MRGRCAGLVRKLRSSGTGIDGTVFWSTAGSAFEKISLTRVQGDYGLADLKYGPFTYMTTVVI